MGYLYYRWNDLDSASSYIEHSLRIRTEIGDSSGIGICLNRLGNIYWFQDDQIRAKDNFNGALLIHRALNEKKEIGRSLTNIANLYRNWGDYREALDLFLEALEYYKADDFQEGIGWLHFSISLLYSQLDDYEKSLDHIYHSLNIYQELAKSARDSTGIMICYGQLGNIYSRKGDLEKALKYQLDALRLRKKSGVKAAIADGMTAIGKIYFQMGNDPVALEYLQQALKLRDASKSTAGIATILKHMGFIYQKKGNYEMALDYQRQALDLARDRKDRANERDILERISEIYSEKNQFSTALDYYKQYTAVKDSIFNYEISNRIASLQIQYEISEQVKENRLLAQENHIKELTIASQKNLRNFLIVLVLSSFTIVIGIILLYRKKIKDNRLLATKNAEIIEAHRQLEQEIDQRKQIAKEREKLIEEQKESLSKIKTLRGLIPICANCKKIRDDEGYWHGVETYVTEHSEAVFSHGICPDCINELYPQYAKKKLEKEQSSKKSR